MSPFITNEENKQNNRPHSLKITRVMKDTATKMETMQKTKTYWGTTLD